MSTASNPSIPSPPPPTSSPPLTPITTTTNSSSSTTTTPTTTSANTHSRLLRLWPSITTTPDNPPMPSPNVAKAPPQLPLPPLPLPPPQPKSIPCLPLLIHDPNMPSTPDL